MSPSLQKLLGALLGGVLFFALIGVTPVYGSRAGVAGLLLALVAGVPLLWCFKASRSACLTAFLATFLGAALHLGCNEIYPDRWPTTALIFWLVSAPVIAMRKRPPPAEHQG